MAIQMHLVTADQTPPKHHQKSINFKDDASKKEKKNTQTPSSANERPQFSPRRKFALTKQLLQHGHC
jgi:hypothetical protein